MGLSSDGGEHTNTIDAGLDTVATVAQQAGTTASAPAHGERGRDHIHDHEAGADRLPEQKGARLASRRRPHDLGPAVVLAGPEIKAPLEGLVVTLLEALVVLSYPPPEHHPPGACSAGGTATVSACSSMQAATFSGTT